MADLIVVVADVQEVGNTNTVSLVQVGEPITQGEPVYLKASDSKYWRCNATALEASTCAGVALTPGATADDYIRIVSAGTMDLGVTLVVSEEYVLSNVDGGISPAADLATTEYYTRVGYGKTADNFVVDITNSGIQHP